MKNTSKLKCLVVILLFNSLSGFTQPITFSRIYNFGIASSLLSVQQTSDSGYVACGGIGQYYEDAYILKLNKSGDTIWTRSYGYSYRDWASDIQITSDGGYIVAGRKNYHIDMEHGNMYGDIWILKLNTNGDTIWTKTYGGKYNDYANSIKQTSDGGYIVAGTKNYMYINSSRDIWILKLDQHGDTLWTKTIHNWPESEASSIIQTSNGDFVFTGGVGVCKLSNSGDSIWYKNLNSFTGKDVIQTSDGNFIAVGFFNNSEDKIIKLDTKDNTIWENLYPPANGYYFQSNALALNESGDIISVGQRINTNNVGNTSNDLWIKKNLSSGTSVWTKTRDLSINDIGNSVKATNDNGFIISGVTNYSAWLLKLDPNCDLTLNVPNLAKDSIDTWNYPNPFSGSTTIYYTNPEANNEKIEIDIFNSVGNIVKTIIQTNPKENHVLFESADLSPGIFFYKINHRNSSICKKMILVR